MDNVTKKFIRQVLNTNFDDFSEKTIKETKIAILDTVGCMIAGTQSPIGKTALEVMGGFGGVEEATVIGDGRKLPAPLAAYITGQCSMGPDLSDSYMATSYAISHPGEAVIPAVLALGEKVGSSLEDVFTAVILGYETAARYAYSIEPRREEIYSFSTHYTLAAAVACAKMLHYDEDKAINTLGIAGALAPLPVTKLMWGFRERPASWHRDMPGHANFAAVMACLFAETDFKGTHLLLEEKVKYYKIAGSDFYNPDLLFKTWGDGYAIDTIVYKSIPSCYFNQNCIQAVIELIEENDLQIEEIDKIELYAPTEFAKNFIFYPPQTTVDTASSVKYLTAVYLLTQKPGPDWYLDFEKYLQMDKYKAIASKIEVFPDDGLQNIFDMEEKVLGKAKISTGEKILEKTVQWVKGSPHKPFTTEELIQKFKNLSEPVVGSKGIEDFLNEIINLDRKKSIKKIISLL
jgi:2-methylcitrate dehydratase PrpD